MWVYLLNKTHASIVFVYTHKRVCVIGCYPVSISTDHTLHLHVSVCLLHPHGLLCPLPKPVCKDTQHSVDVCVNVCVCLLFCSLFCDSRMLSPRLPPLPHCNPSGDIKGKPEKGYLEKRVAKQPNTHHPQAPPTQNSVPGLQPD